jgi:MFS superfamily sulfate permease-like transporter
LVIYPGAVIIPLTTTGAVGVSLFLVGLEVTLPPGSPHLSFSTLFANSHLPLFATSAVPAMWLSMTTRFAVFKDYRLTKNLTQHPLYIPLFCFAVASIFWIVVTACGDIDRESLATNGWLFMANLNPQHATATSVWNYWRLFNFTKVEWRAISAGVRDIVLLVFIGSLSLPIFASAAALEVEVSKFSMNQELLGHGISNVVSGAFGTLPNLIVS